MPASFANKLTQVVSPGDAPVVDSIAGKKKWQQNPPKIGSDVLRAQSRHLAAITEFPHNQVS